MSEKVIAFAGRIASGKSSISIGVAAKLCVPRVSFGDYVRKITALIGRDSANRAILQDVGEFLASDPDVLCQQVLMEAGYLPGKPLIVDGLRHHEVFLELIRQVHPASLTLVYLTADDKSLATRRMARGVADVGNYSIIEGNSTEIQVPNILRDVADILIDVGKFITAEEAVEEVIKLLNCNSY